MNVNRSWVARGNEREKLLRSHNWRSGKHSGSHKQFNHTKARRMNAIQKASRKANRL